MGNGASCGSDADVQRHRRLQHSRTSSRRQLLASTQKEEYERRHRQAARALTANSGRATRGSTLVKQHCSGKDVSPVQRAPRLAVLGHLEEDDELDETPPAVGNGDPDERARRLARLRSRFPSRPLGVHLAPSRTDGEAILRQEFDLSGLSAFKDDDEDAPYTVAMGADGRRTSTLAPAASAIRQPARQSPSLPTAYPKRASMTTNEDLYVLLNEGTPSSAARGAHTQTVPSAAPPGNEDNSPWLFNLTEMPRTPDATPAGIVEYSALPPSRDVTSTTPRPFSPPTSTKSRSSDTESTDSEAERKARWPQHQIALVRDPAMSAQRQSPSEKERRAPESASKLRFSGDFFDLCFGGDKAAPLFSPREVQTPVASSTCATAACTEEEEEEEEEEDDLVTEPPLRPSQRQTADMVISDWPTMMRERSPTPALSPAALPQVHLSAARSAPGRRKMPSASQPVPSPRQPQTAPHTTTLAAVFPSLKRATTDTTFVSDGKCGLPWMLPQTPVRDGHEASTYLSKLNFPPLGVSNAVLKPRRRRRASFSASPDTPLGMSAGSVSFILAREQAQLAIASSQKMSLAQPRLDEDSDDD